MSVATRLAVPLRLWFLRHSRGGNKKKGDVNPAKQVTTATSVVAGGSGTTGQQPGDLNYPRSGPARSRDLA